MVQLYKNVRKRIEIGDPVKVEKEGWKGKILRVFDTGNPEWIYYIVDFGPIKAMYRSSDLIYAGKK